VARLASCVISGNGAGLDRAGAGQIYSPGNNLAHGDLSDVVGALTPVPGSRDAEEARNPHKRPDGFLTV